MARRALRRIDPSLDLATHLRTFEQLPRPWDAAALFPCRAPLEVEVGAGKGLFVRTAAARRPEVNFLALEISLKFAQFAAAGVLKDGLANAIVVAADAVRVFAELLPSDALAAVHIYFPDPWWKSRHKKRRVFRESFVRDLERTLEPGGRLHFWTDVREYFEEALAMLAAQTNLAGPLEVSETTPAHDMDYRTHFERRTRLHGEPVWRAEFLKPANPAHRNRQERTD